MRSASWLATLLSVSLQAVTTTTTFVATVAGKSLRHRADSLALTLAPVVAKLLHRWRQGPVTGSKWRAAKSDSRTERNGKEIL